MFFFCFFGLGWIYYLSFVSGEVCFMMVWFEFFFVCVGFFVLDSCGLIEMMMFILFKFVVLFVFYLLSIFFGTDGFSLIRFFYGRMVIRRFF